MKPGITSGVSGVFQIALGAVMLLFFPAQTPAQPANDLSDAEIHGRALVQQVLDALGRPPNGDSTNTGTLEIRDAAGKKTRVPLTFKVIQTGTDWRHVYEAGPANGMERLTETYRPGQPPELTYDAPGQSVATFPAGNDFPLQNHPFAHSDFLIGDLDLAFLYWPHQAILKKDIHRSRGCIILVSTNPDPSAGGYSRVQSWVDTETLGIVEAYAYDAGGKLLKDFYPKNFKKVDGQYQVETLIMENEQTDSRSRLDFDLDK